MMPEPGVEFRDIAYDNELESLGVLKRARHKPAPIVFIIKDVSRFLVPTEAVRENALCGGRKSG
jgi:hypothetical protein